MNKNTFSSQIQAIRKSNALEATVWNEGGNLNYKLKDGTVIQADKIDLSKIKRTDVTEFIKKFILELNKIFTRKFKAPLFEQAAIKDWSILSGSSRLLLDSNISDLDFVTAKPKVGDIDLMVPASAGNSLKILLKELNGKSILGGTVEFVKVNPAKETEAKGQDHMMLNKTFGDTTVRMQFDFEYLPFKKGAPTEWAQFSHSSDWEDVRQGVKSVFHKKLIQAITKIVDKDFHKEAIIVTKTGALKTVHEPHLLSRTTFSVDYGVRTDKFRLALKDGKSYKIEGKTAYEEKPSSESKYKSTIKEIFEILFQKVPSAEEKTKFKSFIGILELLKQNFSNEEIIAVSDYFVDTIFGSRAQRLEASDPLKDREAKEAAMQKIFEKFSFIKKNKYNSIIKKYYEGYKTIK